MAYKNLYSSFRESGFQLSSKALHTNGAHTHIQAKQNKNKQIFKKYTEHIASQANF